MEGDILELVDASRIDSSARFPITEEALETVQPIIDTVKHYGEAALREISESYGDLKPGDKLFYSRADLKAALDSIDDADREVLERVGERVRKFALAQRESIAEIAVPVPGGSAGHQIAPVSVAGCYAPGGRFPLPSTVLMTAVTARAAGVKFVWVASPKPTPITLAAAAIADVDGLMAAGGAQALAAMAFGCGDVPKCDVIVGPGNRYVTAAKKALHGYVNIDMLAGPSELVVVADATADPAMIASDLLAQAEHDPDALPILVATEKAIVGQVQRALKDQLKNLPTREIAEQSLKNGFATVVRDMAEASAVCSLLAPEHLQLCFSGASEIAHTFNDYGGLFIGHNTAEVIGDYGAGPNHVLPTGGTARFSGGLSVLTFLRVRTWLRIDSVEEALGLYEDAEHLARLEGLYAHARAAQRRLTFD